MPSIGAIPIFDNLKKQGVISEPVFAFYLSKCRGKDSVMMFGGVDKAYYMGELKWLTQAGAIPIFDNLKKQGAISEPVFAFYLSKSKPEGSVVMFGGVDRRSYKGELSWVPVSQPRHWLISMNQ
ncbi:hypothetical protein MG293_019834 [Ovis ammon polii]|uniref:Peptidase A1 domain-containing protein n=1 Tax=Ovis ammon polii TaxID=230172 RepID=A0AAD4Y0B2_OVIAM|nr:hypothetical protein MG293_019834 [Ovis ammon polii]